MSTIARDTRIVTLINTFQVEPARQAELAALLDDVTMKYMRHVPGFISANIHKSVDGQRVLNYAQWESKDAFDAMMADPRAREHMAAAARLAGSFDPVWYDVTAVHSRGA